MWAWLGFDDPRPWQLIARSRLSASLNRNAIWHIAIPVEEPSTASIADVLPHKLVTLMKTMRLADNSHHRFKRWFDKEV